MSEDLYAKPDLSKKVRFQTGETEKSNTDIGENTDNAAIYDNAWAEEITLPKPQESTEDKPQSLPSASATEHSEKRNRVRVVDVFLGLLCLILQAAIIVLLVIWIGDINKWTMMKNQLTTDRDQLQTSYDALESITLNLTQKTIQLHNEKKDLINKKHQLQVNNSELESVKVDLTRKTSQLENEKKDLEELNRNLTHKIDELQKQSEKTCNPANWIKSEDSCYFISTDERNWWESKKYCNKQHSHLLIISNENEQRLFSSLDFSFWIGLKRDRQNWIWIDGSTMSSGYWRTSTNEPSNHEGENCVEIGYGDELQTWNDLHCWEKRKFVCEKQI